MKSKRTSAKRERRKIIKKNNVMCFGTFDLLHPGHLSYFQQAKKYGDYLLVVVARDATKKKFGKKTWFNEEERFHLLKKVALVDEVLLGDLEDYLKVILQKKPQTLCLGYDQTVNQKQLKLKLAQHNFYPKIVRLQAYQPKKNKSSLLKKKLSQFF